MDELYEISEAQEAPDNRNQKNWLEVVNKKIVTELLPQLGEDGVKRLDSYEDKFTSQSLNDFLCEKLNLRLSNQQLRISIDLREEAKRSEPHVGVCGEETRELRLHGLLLADQ